MTVFLSDIEFTNRSDTVNETELILNDDFQGVNTLGGKDSIITNIITDIPNFLPMGSEFANLIGILNLDATLLTGQGKDLITGKVKYTGTDGLGAVYGVENLNGNLNTGNQNDIIRGTVELSPSSFTSLGAGIYHESAVTETGYGNDLIHGKFSGQGSLSFGVFISSNSNLDTGFGNDRIEAEASGSAASGVMLGIAVDLSTITTGKGKDLITGSAHSDDSPESFTTGIAIGNDSSVDTGANEDVVMGSAEGLVGEAVGIAVIGVGIIGGEPVGGSSLYTGSGNDIVKGVSNATATREGTAGISVIQSSEINTGDGIDILTGMATNSSDFFTTGILVDSSLIDMGDGNDIVISAATQNGNLVNSFGGDGNINMGNGNDFIRGFGNISLDGGNGNQDILDLSQYNYTDFEIVVDDTSLNRVDFNLAGTQMFTEGFEQFIFGDIGIISYVELV